MYLYKINFASPIGPENGIDDGVSSLRDGWRSDLNTLLQWREIDQNCSLSSHVGHATNIFGVSSTSGGCGNENDGDTTSNKQEGQDSGKAGSINDVGTKKGGTDNTTKH